MRLVLLDVRVTGRVYAGNPAGGRFPLSSLLIFLSVLCTGDVGFEANRALLPSSLDLWSHLNRMCGWLRYPVVPSLFPENGFHSSPALSCESKTVRVKITPYRTLLVVVHENAQCCTCCGFKHCRSRKDACVTSCQGFPYK